MLDLEVTLQLHPQGEQVFLPNWFSSLSNRVIRGFNGFFRIKDIVVEVPSAATEGTVGDHPSLPALRRTRSHPSLHKSPWHEGRSRFRFYSRRRLERAVPRNQRVHDQRLF